ncbi:MAG: hypothetical protein EOM30_06055 [Clostridia bacterium]|nr:hypothetical protein [Clostridia bacterium]NLS84129.1 hypothetical protein [Oscillospiraceae bacterium]
MKISLKVHMLGRVSVEINGQKREFAQDKLTKPWQLFCYIVLRGKNVVPSKELIEVLWSESDLLDAANVLKNTVYALRRELFGDAKASESPIAFKKDGYCLSDDVDLWLDVDEYLHLCDVAESEDGTDDEKIAACQKALGAYTGDVLPMLSSEPWAVLETRKCKRHYIFCAHVLCRLLADKCRWNAILPIAQCAILIDPFDEECTTYLFRALYNSQMWRSIVSSYSRISRFFKDELGKDMNSEITKIFIQATGHVNKTEQELLLIKDDITENSQHPRNQRDAYYCSYDMLKYIYQFMQRSAERSRQTLMLMLVTLTPTAPRVKADDIVHAMEDTRVAISRSMRRSDAFARYGKSQYAIVFPITQDENIVGIQARLDSAYADIHSEKKFTLGYKYIKI